MSVGLASLRDFDVNFPMSREGGKERGSVSRTKETILDDNSVALLAFP